MTSSETVVRAACPHDCPDTCAMLVTVRQEPSAGARRIAVAVAGDPEHPTTAGTLCTKVARYLDRTYSDERVLLKSSPTAIADDRVTLKLDDRSVDIRNDAVIVCAGGELPTPLLKKIGVLFETKHGES